MSSDRLALLFYSLAAARSGPPEVLTNCYLDISRHFRRASQAPLAIAYAGLALQVAPNPSLRPRASLAKASALIWNREYLLANFNLESVLDSAADSYLIARAQSFLSIVHHKLGKPQQSVDAARSSLELWFALCNPHEVAVSQTNLATALLPFSSQTEIETLCTSASAYFERTGQPDFLVGPQDTLARIGAAPPGSCASSAHILP